MAGSRKPIFHVTSPPVSLSLSLSPHRFRVSAAFPSLYSFGKPSLRRCQKDTLCVLDPLLTCSFYLHRQRQSPYSSSSKVQHSSGSSSSPASKRGSSSQYTLLTTFVQCTEDPCIVCPQGSQVHRLVRSCDRRASGAAQ